jgi:uncharacterized pyridoxamine 5'-phosphate oxidase family protein
MVEQFPFMYKQGKKIHIHEENDKQIRKGMVKEKEKSFSKYIVEAGVLRAGGKFYKEK